MNYANIPMRTIGPININAELIKATVRVPLATYESPLWPSVNRGAKISRAIDDGIRIILIDDRMTRSIIIEADSSIQLYDIKQKITNHKSKLNELVMKNSRFIQLLDINFQVVGNLLYIRLEFNTGDAAGHNMATKAADEIINWILKQNKLLRYVSISGNYCVDKKVSAINGILGRGKYVVAEMLIPKEICHKYLHTTPEKIVNLNLKKNWIGSNLAGSIRSANAHFANMLLAFYLATGQDAANIIEGSQGFVYTELQKNSLYFSVTLPNIIIGTVGNGKNFDFVQNNLDLMGCSDQTIPGINAKRLAIIAAATVCCGELSLLAAQTNRGELMRSHLILERDNKSC